MSTLDRLPTLAAVHMPKTAGTTFLHVLREAYGDALLLDYEDRPLSHPSWSRRLVAARHAVTHAGRTQRKGQCIYGHYMPLKYSAMRGLSFCTWLRDPVQRVLSRYHHYQRNALNEPHHARWGLVPGLSLEQFVRLPQYRNTYAEYFWMFPLSRFDFIGIVEDFSSELERFARLFEIANTPHITSVNRNPDKRAHTAYAVDAGVENLIRTLNARDVEIYARACERRPR